MPPYNPSPQELRRIADSVLNDEVFGIARPHLADKDAHLSYGFTDLLVIPAPNPDPANKPPRWYVFRMPPARRDYPPNKPQRYGPYADLDPAWTKAEQLQRTLNRSSRIIIPASIDRPTEEYNPELKFRDKPTLDRFYTIADALGEHDCHITFDPYPDEWIVFDATSCKDRHYGSLEEIYQCEYMGELLKPIAEQPQGEPA